VIGTLHAPARTWGAATADTRPIWSAASRRTDHRLNPSRAAWAWGAAGRNVRTSGRNAFPSVGSGASRESRSTTSSRSPGGGRGRGHL